LGGQDPEVERVYWHSDTASPVGEIGLNFGRFEDDVIDELRGTQDAAVIAEQAETINRRFAEQVYNVWFDRVHWAVPHKLRVRGVRTPLALPDGALGATDGISYPGGISETQIWVDDAE
jgi:hypothetical protein